VKSFGLTREKLRSPLARRLIVAMVLVSSAITLCLTALQLYGEYRSSLGDIQAVFRQIEEVHLKSLSQSLWATGEVDLRLQIEGIVRVPNLDYIVVREGDRIWAQAGRRASRNVIERQYQMTYIYRGQTLEIGLLTVVASLDAVYRDLVKRAFIILASNALKTFLVAGFAFAFFHWLVSRHLLSIAEYLHGLDSRERTSTLILARAAGRRPDELDEVATQLNRILDVQQAAQAQLRESEERLRQRALIFENATDAIMILDPQRHILDWNPASERLFGYRKHEVLGRTTEFLNRPDDYAKYTPIIDATIARGERWVMERVMLRKDGTERICETIRAPLFDAGGTLIGRIGLARDITERKQAEEARARLAAIVENSNDAIIGRGHDLKVISWNAAAERILGYTAAEVIGRDLDNHPPDLRHEAMEIRRLVGTGVSVPYVETVRMTKDGRRIDVGLSVSPIRDSNGKVIGTAATLRDITERKRAEEALREREHRMRLVTENVPAMITYFDAELICRFANTAFCELYRLNPQDVIGKELREIVGANTYRVIRPGIDLIKEGRLGMSHRQEPTATGGIRQIEIHRVPDMSPEGAFRGYYAMLLDITERRQAEQALQAAHARLRDLTAHMQSAIESERARIARDVHDSLGGALTGISMDLSWCIKQLKPARVKRDALDRLRVMVGQAGDAMREVRRIITDLRPSILDHLGLWAALDWLAQDFAERYGVPCRIKHAGTRRIGVPPDCATAVFRIVQEALTNVARHAYAAHVTIRIDNKGDELVLKVIDDGKGASPEHLASPDSYGILGMRERAVIFGGSVKVTGVRAVGTSVELRLPLTAVVTEEG